VTVGVLLAGRESDEDVVNVRVNGSHESLGPSYFGLLDHVVVGGLAGYR
jgi:hypothetical protein